MVKGEHAQAVKDATTSILPVWLEAFKVLLAINPQNDVSTDNWDGLRVRSEIYHVCSLAILSSVPNSSNRPYPKSTPRFPEFLPRIWATFSLPPSSTFKHWHPR